MTKEEEDAKREEEANQSKMTMEEFDALKKSKMTALKKGEARQAEAVKGKNL